jgi:hypothetical protein
MTASASADPYPSTYRPLPSEVTLIRGATVLTAAGPRIENGSVLLRDGKVEAVGTSIEAPAGATVIDAKGKWVTPGIIDIHSHLGVYASPGVTASSDGNEATSPVTAQVWAEHSIWPQDPGFHTALAGGITSLQILPGSANLIGGRGVTLKNVSSVTYQGMKFPGAPWGLKMACGENPKRVYGNKGGPSTRMGNMAGYRAAFADAALGFGRALARTLLRHDLSQRQNLRLTAFRRALRLLDERLRDAKCDDAKVNPAPEAYRVFPPPARATADGREASKPVTVIFAWPGLPSDFGCITGMMRPGYVRPAPRVKRPMTSKKWIVLK